MNKRISIGYLDIDIEDMVVIFNDAEKVSRGVGDMLQYTMERIFRIGLARCFEQENSLPYGMSPKFMKERVAIGNFDLSHKDTLEIRKRSFVIMYKGKKSYLNFKVQRSKDGRKENTPHREICKHFFEVYYRSKHC